MPPCRTGCIPRPRQRAGRASPTFRSRREVKRMRKRDKAFRPDRIGAYFRAEWLPLGLVTVSGLVYNVGLLAAPWPPWPVRCRRRCTTSAPSGRWGWRCIWSAAMTGASATATPPWSAPASTTRSIRRWCCWMRSPPIWTPRRSPACWKRCAMRPRGRTVLSISHRVYESLGGRTVELLPQ